MNASGYFGRLLAAAVGVVLPVLCLSGAVASADVSSTETSSTTATVNGPSVVTVPAPATGPAKAGKWHPARPNQLDPDWLLDPPTMPAGEPATAAP